MESIDFGVKTGENTMTVMQTLQAVPQGPVALVLNLHGKPRIELKFAILVGKKIRMCQLKIPPAQMQHIDLTSHQRDQVSMTFSLTSPAECYWQPKDESDMHMPGQQKWDERNTYNRLTDIDRYMDFLWSKPVTLQRHTAYIDTGRWLTYRLVLPRGAHRSESFESMRAALKDYNVDMVELVAEFLEAPPKPITWSHSSTVNAPESQSLSDLEHLHQGTPHLSFEVAYQLEVCLSHNYLVEQTLTAEFMAQLAIHPNSQRILEHIAQDERRFYDPMQIFKIHARVAKPHTLPTGCVLARSVNVTPTTIYVNTPSVEISNRTIRAFSYLDDRFLRVRFQDEDFYGRLFTQRDNANNAVLLRIKRTFKRGIIIGGRRYEFLGWSNSQFKENGAYFFAPTTSISTDDVRKWMGVFDEIRNPAKYASRLGQCFSTTRAITSIGKEPKVTKIPDIIRNGHCFTDGVGKMSPFLAQMIGQADASRGAEYPSLVQFRMGGCKGVLVIDPGLTGKSVHIRPSQEKFQTDYSGLEICEVSSFKTSYLNRQVILILTALGVPKEVFLDMTQEMISGLDKAMKHPALAIKMLAANVDYNQTTLVIAKMLMNGLINEPFVAAVLQLWRASTMKMLREKAKILVEKSAYVFGCVDETRTLRTDGEYPEVFLQIPDPERKGSYKPLLGTCILFRSPTMHPGDIRVVQGVDCPNLKHLKNVVVLPQTGDRPLANMCSGGDLDGDEYSLMWDPRLLPTDRNYPPMDYEPPPPIVSELPITMDDLTNFFCDFLKNDSLGTISNSHLAWADQLSVLCEQCECEADLYKAVANSFTGLRLAPLASMAVDYAKTGVPAIMDDDLKVRKSPHFMGKPPEKSYNSTSVLGCMYDQVLPIEFHASYEPTFNAHILEAYELDTDVLRTAMSIKEQYDQDIKRIMAQNGIQTEFEVWTAFVMSHNREIKDFSFAQDMGRLMLSVKNKYVSLCRAKVGLAGSERDLSKLHPLIAAIYKVTADEVTASYRSKEPKPIYEHEEDHVLEHATAFMSCPWIFADELGKIAKSRLKAEPMPRRLSAATLATESALEPAAVTPGVETHTAREASMPRQASTKFDSQSLLIETLHEPIDAEPELVFGTNPPWNEDVDSNELIVRHGLEGFTLIEGSSHDSASSMSFVVVDHARSNRQTLSLGDDREDTNGEDGVATEIKDGSGVKGQVVVEMETRRSPFDILGGLLR